MRMECNYLVSAGSKEAIDQISDFWACGIELVSSYSFENCDTDVYGVMEKVVRLVHKMEKFNQRDAFKIAGVCETDYDCAIFTIEYDGQNEPLIKASSADPEENEGRYYQFCGAEYKEIPKLLKRNKNRTFKQAIKDNLPLGGFLNCSYDEWVSEILGE